MNPTCRHIDVHTLDLGAPLFKKPSSWPKKTKRLVVLSLCFLAVAAMIGRLVVRHWPYREPAIRSQLAAAASAQVYFGHFHKQYWPPGCVAEDVTLRRANSPQPIMTIQRLTMMSNLTGFLHHRVTLVRAQGMHLWLNLSDLSAKGASDDQGTTDKFEADNSVLEIVERIPEHSLKFIFRSFSITRIRAAKLARFAAVFENPLPRGIVRTSGQFGPWNAMHPEQTAVSGSYSLDNADLAVFRSIAGLTSSSGKFEGTFVHLEVEGATNTPEFKVTDTQHALPLETHFNALVDATNGNVTLQKVRAHFGRDHVDAHGIIARQANHRRAAILDLDCRHGRIEDTFYPFIHSPASPLTGAVAVQMHVVIPSGSERFLKRIKVESEFHIQDARFTRSETQSRVEKIGQTHDEGKLQEANTFSDLQGKVQLSNGFAHFPQLSLQDGGATAQFRGSYNLVDEHVDMHGRLQTEATLAKTTHGIKAVFAKALEPFFKKKRHQNVVPVRITGTYRHPNFGLDLNSKM